MRFNRLSKFAVWNARQLVAIVSLCSVIALLGTQKATAQDSDVTNDNPGVATIVVRPNPQAEPAFLYSVNARSKVLIGSESIDQTVELAIKVVQGKPATVTLGIVGPGEVLDVSGDTIESWSVRSKGDERFLDLQVRASREPQLEDSIANATIRMVTQRDARLAETALLHLGSGKAIGFDSQIELDYAPELTGRVVRADGFVPLFAEKHSNRYQTSTGGHIVLRIERKSIAPAPIELRDAALVGELAANGQSIRFTLTGTADATEAMARLRVLSGNAAFSELPASSDYRVELVRSDAELAYDLVFPTAGSFPVKLTFVAGVTKPDGNWSSIDLAVAASAVVPLTLQGFAPEIEFQRDPQTVVPVSEGTAWRGFLPATGRVHLQWKDAQSSNEGKLFFTTTARVEAKVGTGLLHQDHQLTYQVLQGQLKALSVQIHGPGEIIDVEGSHLVGWKVTDKDGSQTLEITLSQPIHGESTILIRSQTPLETFPVRVEGMRLQPVGAIRHSGFLRVSNIGSVRVEASGLQGLTQLAPEQFPGEAIQARQSFVYRFPSAEYSLSLMADRVQPEVNVNALMLYQLSESDRSIVADIEMDIREAAIREWDILIPADYSVVSIVGASLADYVVASEQSEGHRNVKLIFQSDVLGRQLISVRLEKSETAVAGPWKLPRFDFPQAKDMRGDVGIAGAAGLRIVASETSLLLEKPLSYFPKPLPNLQQAFRIREPGWSATMQIEQLDRSIQSDVFHLYSLSQGTIYGSALVNYLVTGSPTSEFQLTVPQSLGNVTVDGQGIRTWRREGDTLHITLHQPVLGPYTLLVTFEEKPIATDGTFSAGVVAPMNVQGDRGYIEIVSPVQVEVVPQTVSAQLLVLDSLELPGEFRLLSAAPSLGTWQYTERPFDLKLKVTWFEPGHTAGQVVEFSEANSRVSPDGELVTDVLYYVKSRGQRTLRLQLPAEPVKLWAVTVNGQPVTARQTGNETLVPLPGGADPNIPIEVGLRLGKPSLDRHTADLLLPIVDAPVLKTQWNVRGDENYVLVPSGGTVEPTAPILWPTGFEWLANRGLMPLVATSIMIVVGLFFAWRRGWRILSLMCFAISILLSLAATGDALDQWHTPGPIELNLPVLAAGESIALQVHNVPAWRVQISWIGFGLIAGGIVLLVLSWAIRIAGMRRVLRVVGLALLLVGLLMHPNGASGFFAVIAAVAFFCLLIPTLKAWWQDFIQRRRAKRIRASTSPSSSHEAGAVITSVLMLFVAWNATIHGHTAQAVEPIVASSEIASADSLIEQWQITSEASRLIAKATIQVTGIPGDRFILLQAPATLTRFDSDRLQLSKIQVADHGLVYAITIPSDADGETENTEGETNPGKTDDVKPQHITATFEYQLEAVQTGSDIPVLTGRAALHEVELSIDQSALDIRCKSAVRIEVIDGNESETRGKILLSPGPASIALQPRSRDLSNEETLFFVEGSHLYTPGPGVVDGRHRLDIRTAQGRIKELSVSVPDGLTVSNVEGPVASWQFDADSRQLQLQMQGSVNSNFHVIVETQRGLDTLPTEVSLSPLRIAKASGEVGLLGIAFSSDAQPERVDSKTLSMVSLSDLDASLNKNPHAVLHRVYRYGKESGAIDVRVAPVTPEVRVASRQALSIGDERILLNVGFTVDITRTGLFQLSFPLPDGMEVESLTGNSLHHWIETSQGGKRQIAMHLNGKTIGSHQFSLSMTGAAPTNEVDWQVPRFELNEADRQTGDLLVRPTTGLRLRSVTRQNVSETDPRSMSGPSEGALAFRLLQRDWDLKLGIEKLEAWITGDVLHEVTLREGQTRSTISADFDVQNASIRSLVITLPISDSEVIKTVRASGKSVADFVRTSPDSDRWEIQFKQRVIGRVQFQIEFERRGERANDSESMTVAGFPDTRKLAYYMAVRTGGRLEIEPGVMPEGWQRIDWSVVPAALRDSGPRTSPALSLRAIAPTESLSIRVIRHSLAESLKLRVAAGKLTTLLSPTGDQLTAVDVTVEVIQRSSLSVALPKGGELFNIFVNGESVHSIRQNDASNAWQFYILPGIDDRTAQVRFVYLVTGDSLRAMKLSSPMLNVPLENVTWDVIAPRGYEMTSDAGDLELINRDSRGVYDRSFYLSKVSDKRKSQAIQAQQMLAQATELLQAGEQTKAQRALSNVANSNALDAASNEDARVQLENLQTQQAIVGLNTRRQRLYLDSDFRQTDSGDNEQMRQAAAVNPILQQDQLKFRPQELSQLLAGNTSEDNAVLQQIAGRLVQHQRTTEPAPQAIVISIPEEGNVYSFSRSVQVEENAPLELDLRFRSEYKMRLWEWFMIGGVISILAIGSALLPRRSAAS